MGTPGSKLSVVQPTAERLESWKDIASYLKHGVRTVQRWERTEGLPVHRHVHEKRGSVYAYRAELDVWWQNGRTRLEQDGRLRLFRRLAVRRPRGVLAWMAVGLAVPAGLWLALHRPGAHEMFLMAVPLTTYQGTEMEPSFSPDGQQVAFFWDGDKQDNCDIYVKLIGSEKLLRLTTDRRVDAVPSWSPDGRWIAFLRLPETGSKAALLLIPALGGPERKLAEVVGRPRLSWSPDGQSLAFYDERSPGEPLGLSLLSITTGEKSRLTSPPADTVDDSPAFSPDSRLLLFNRVGRSNSALYLLALSANLKPKGEAKRLTLGDRSASVAVWTSDGRQIVFSSVKPDRGWDLMKFPASGTGEPTRLALGENMGPDLAVSRQGNRLAYSVSTSDMNIWRVEIPRETGKTSVPASFISSTRQEMSPRYSPDGRKIVFASDRSGGLQVWVSDSDGRNPVQLTTSGGAGAAWSPDSRQIVYSWGGHIHVISSEGGAPRLISTPPAYGPTWSHDGKWIYFGSSCTGRCQLWKVPAGGGGAVQMTRAKEHMLVSQWGEIAAESPDGRFLYYLYMKRYPQAGLWRTPVEGGQDSEVLGSVPVDGFAVAERGIYFLTSQAGARTGSIQFFNIHDRTTQMIARLPNPALMGGPGLSVSPDGRWILYAQEDRGGSDLMLVENFR